MKKVLITGMNKSQCTKDFFLQQQLKVPMNYYGLFRGLKDMGWEVEQREVVLGEDLSKYDEVFVYLHNPAGFSGYIYNGLYAISKRPDCILTFDDWQMDSIYAGLLSFKDESAMFRKYVIEQNLGGGVSEENIKKYKSDYLNAISILEEKKNRMAISAFSGGDLSLCLEYPKNLMYSYNPNPYHLNRVPGKTGDKPTASIFTIDPLRPDQKIKQWNFASLVQGRTKKWFDSQNPTWPVNFYGSRKDKQERLTEEQMVQIFEKQWGCLMPGYYHAGSGWWRSRPLQVANANSIIVCEDAEGRLFSEAHVGLTCDYVEGLDLEGLTKLAKAQKEGMYERHPLSKTVFKNELQTIFDAKQK